MGNPLIHKETFRSLLPSGWAWRLAVGSVFDKLLTAMSQEPARVEDRIAAFIREIDPRTTDEMADNWESLLGIPDECDDTTVTKTLPQRRNRIMQKLLFQGGNTSQFFKDLCAQYGFTVDVIEVREYREFRAGRARAGDRISNAAGWGSTFKIVLPATLIREFRAGQSVAGDRLRVVENNALECVVRKSTPAHLNVLFTLTV